MAGRARSFTRSAFKFPKHLIQLNGISILARSFRGMTPENLNQFSVVDENWDYDLTTKITYYFIVRRDHFDKYDLRTAIHDVVREAIILLADYHTDGQACTALSAESKIGNDDPLIIMSPDQVIQWNPINFLAYSEESLADVCMVVTKDLLSGTKPFVVDVDDDKKVHGIYEKRKKGAKYYDCGVYYFKYGWYFPLFCKSMISRNASIGGEYFVGMTINDAIVAGKRVDAHQVSSAGLFRKPQDIRTFMKKAPEWIM